MYDRKCYVDIRLLGCALVLLVMALLTIHTGLDKKAVTAAADPAPAAVVSTQDTRLSEDAGSVRYGCVHVENLLPDFCKRKSSPSILESEPCKSKIVTVSVEFRAQKFLGTVLGTKSRFRDKKIPKVTSKYTKALSWNYQIVTRFHKKNGISKLATFS